MFLFCQASLQPSNDWVEDFLGNDPELAELA
jgi:hypothetical protein